MRIQLNTFTFGDSKKIYKSGTHTVEEHYNDNKTMIKRLENDEFSRDVDTKWFDDKTGELTAHQHKDYYEKENETGYIETYKDNSQEYTRHGYTRIENGCKHTVEDYQSKTGKSYINEFIRDAQDKLIKIITNGKVTEL